MSLDVGAAIYIAIKPILKIYAIMFIGFLLARYNIVSMEVARGISNMVVNAILPCLTFNKIVSNISWKDIKVIGVILLSAILLFAVGGACSLITKFITPAPKLWFWGLLFGGIFPNISDLPIAYMQSMGNGMIFNEDQTNKGVAYSCIFLFAQSFLMMNFGMWRLVGLDFKDIQKDTDSDTDTDTDACIIRDINSDDQLDSESEGKNSSRTSQDGSSFTDFQKNLKLPTVHVSTRYTHEQYDVPHHSDMDTNSDAFELYSIDSYLDSEYDGVDNNDNNNNNNNNYINENASPQLDQGGSRKHITAKKDGAPLSYYGMNKIAPVISSPAALRTHKISLSNNKEPQFNLARKLSITRALGKSLTRTQTGKSVANSMIAEYSAVRRIKSGQLDLHRPLTLTQYIGEENTCLGSICDEQSSVSHDIENIPHSTVSQNTTNINNLSEVHENKKKTTPMMKKIRIKLSKFIRRYHLSWVSYFLINCLRPASLGALLGIICALIPWVKACFVDTYVHVHKAPDTLPVLNFVMDFTEYIGNACVPLGLLLLGGMLARLEVESIPKGFIKTVIMLTACRLIVIPIIGILWANKLYNMNWLDNDVSKFIMVLTWSMPSATAQVYFTAFYSPVEGKHEQMDCLSIFILIQYAMLFITLSFVVTYTLKVDLKI
ncbi:similar to Saccharomyces cerevisiae YLR152C Putative protein of unknown function [Maudiozyma saulgeensis]|uniref:Uncharacterized protein n=1 Tax=Maudiozyma saulgeensis TaxID=1789683 RepID=A0A1X7R751_9SACH|nr:similar to Saccharomyces cerevisiae YLR152C Putative protein of unknown function [Kazachstania saulgeensis]